MSIAVKRLDRAHRTKDKSRVLMDQFENIYGLIHVCPKVKIVL